MNGRVLKLVSQVFYFLKFYFTIIFLILNAKKFWKKIDQGFLVIIHKIYVNLVLSSNRKLF